MGIDWKQWFWWEWLYLNKVWQWRITCVLWLLSRNSIRNKEFYSNSVPPVFPDLLQNYLWTIVHCIYVMTQYLYFYFHYTVSVCKPPLTGSECEMVTHLSLALPVGRFFHSSLLNLLSSFRKITEHRCAAIFRSLQRCYIRLWLGCSKTFTELSRSCLFYFACVLWVVVLVKEECLPDRCWAGYQ